MHLQQLVNVRIASRIIAGIVIIWLILPFHQIVWIGIQMNACTYTNPIVRVYNSFFTIIAAGLLPPLIMLLCTVGIRYNLARKRNRLVHLRNTLPQHQENHVLRSRDQQTIVMLFVQIFVYIITNIPWTIFFTIQCFYTIYGYVS
jgi:hypothetical protein